MPEFLFFDKESSQEFNDQNDVFDQQEVFAENEVNEVSDKEEIICLPTIPPDEICDGIDNNCNGLVDEGLIGCCVPESEQECGFNDLGECKMGKEICDENGSWGECQGAIFPEDELCDDKDNDCNGKTDEIFNLGMACELGLGECKKFGKTICSQDGIFVICDAVPGEPQDEICDGLDNNCDSKTDEDWPELGTTCENGKGECKASGKMVCDGLPSTGGLTTVCNAIPGTPSDEICDGKDNDCNDLTDEKFPELGTNCSVGKGECKKEGVFVCNLETGFSKCSVSAGAPSEEICDQKDNNCDGIIDNVDAAKLQTDNQHCGACFNPCVNLPNAKSVTCLEGKCQPTECQPKFWNADKKPENGCECQISQGAVEICDNKDNDCDGQTDEMCDNLVMYLSFDDTWQDKSKYGNHATPHNGATFTSDAILGKAAYFDGVDDYATVADSVSMDSISEEFTYFVATKILTNKQSGIMNKWELAPSLIFTGWGSCNGNCFRFQIGGPVAKTYEPNNLNSWFQFAVRYKQGELTIFLDSSLYYQGSAKYPYVPGGNMFIGVEGGPPDTGTVARPLHGNVDEFIFYNKALSDEEIANYYQKIE
jgi:hypothetical protein